MHVQRILYVDRITVVRLTHLRYEVLHDAFHSVLSRHQNIHNTDDGFLARHTDARKGSSMTRFCRCAIAETAYVTFYLIRMKATIAVTLKKCEWKQCNDRRARTIVRTFINRHIERYVLARWRLIGETTALLTCTKCTKAIAFMPRSTYTNLTI